MILKHYISHSGIHCMAVISKYIISKNILIKNILILKQIMTERNLDAFSILFNSREMDR